MTAPLPDAARPAASPLQRRLGRPPARPNDVPRRRSPTPHPIPLTPGEPGMTADDAPDTSPTPVPPDATGAHTAPDPAALANPCAPQTTDAQVWAEEFLKRFGVTAGDERANADDPAGLMVGWFANAIETGRAAGRSAASKPVARDDDTDERLLWLLRRAGDERANYEGAMADLAALVDVARKAAVHAPEGAHGPLGELADFLSRNYRTLPSVTEESKP